MLFFLILIFDFMEEHEGDSVVVESKYVEVDGNSEGRVVMAGIVSPGRIGIRIEGPIAADADLNDIIRRAAKTSQVKDGRMNTSFTMSKKVAISLAIVMIEVIESMPEEDE